MPDAGRGEKLSRKRPPQGALFDIRIGRKRNVDGEVLAGRRKAARDFGGITFRKLT
jgi:hypothetical protein